MSPPDKKCSNCGAMMENAGNMKFRVGGYTGAGGMFLGGWNQLAQSSQTLVSASRGT